ncbi:MAG: hypothetical protein IPM54_11595 [Polyangiaceae bacterium]|nr:hypothetical protein [Polyangiaceae bacterium]
MNAGFFTQRGRTYKVPHDRIGTRWVLIAHQAITRAFDIMRQEGFVLQPASEVDITVKLENVLNNEVLNRGEVDGFDKIFFGKVRRVEVVNHDGTKKSKRPDLCFELRREDRVDWDQLQDALFAECKPVDRDHSLNGHYCAVEKDCTGIERFVIGDYAWAMEEALMIGYVRDGFAILPDLANALTDPDRRAKLGEPTAPTPVDARPNRQPRNALYKTTHKRSFRWRGGKKATPIDIFHSWHDCDRQSG